ncbi:MAG: AAA family ATPase [Cyanobacteria bacterium P01_F01_bin.150]
MGRYGRGAGGCRQRHSQGGGIVSCKKVTRSLATSDHSYRTTTENENPQAQQQGDQLRPISSQSENQANGPTRKIQFIIGPPIETPRHFFGRQLILKRLFNLLKTRPLQNAAIIGQRRSGKTSLLNYLRTITTTPPEQLRPGQRSNWLPQAERYRWIYVDFQDARMAHRQDLLQYLLESMQLPVPHPCDLERFMEQVSGRVQVPTVILMDEVGVGLQRCPELDDGFWESLRSLANQTNGNLAFVLATPEHPMDLARNTGHSSPFFNIFGYTKTLGPFTEAEAQEFIDYVNLPLSQEDIDWLREHSGRSPLLLQILCRERMFSLEEGETDDDWHEEGLKQIQPFIDLLN